MIYGSLICTHLTNLMVCFWLLWKMLKACPWNGGLLECNLPEKCQCNWLRLRPNTGTCQPSQRNSGWNFMPVTLKFTSLASELFDAQGVYKIMVRQHKLYLVRTKSRAVKHGKGWVECWFSKILRLWNKMNPKRYNKQLQVVSHKLYHLWSLVVEWVLIDSCAEERWSCQNKVGPFGMDFYQLYQYVACFLFFTKFSNFFGALVRQTYPKMLYQNWMCSFLVPSFGAQVVLRLSCCQKKRFLAFSRHLRIEGAGLWRQHLGDRAFLD